MKSNKCLQKAFKISAPENWVGGGEEEEGEVLFQELRRKMRFSKLK